ncbi:MAG TPA: serine hydrolase [Thermoanaerobaculia bacterium]|jgi:beta-lactamase class A|nr:serine hydrolase [Thermoanaerobaculia bacterium]
MTHRRITAAQRLALATAFAGALLAIGCAGRNARSAAPPPAPTPTPLPQATDAERGVLPDSALLRQMLEADESLRPMLADAPRHRLQVVLGVVEARPGARPILVQHGFRAGAEYVYPASSVKLFAAVAALERLAELRRESGLAIDFDTPLVYQPLFAGDQVEDKDPSNLAGGKITVAQEIRKIFLVSDNAAFNHLYELVGPDRINASAERAGLPGVRIVHRLSEPHTAEENLRTPRIDFADKRFTWSLPERTAQPLPPAPDMPGLRVGDAYLDGEKRVEGPLDFAAKNRAPLAVLQRALCMVVRPDVDCGGPGFALSEADRELLLRAMRRLPRESVNPRVSREDHPDAYVKFLLPGLRRVMPAVRVYDKSGQAYGFTLDNAWVVDAGTNKSFFLAAALYTNQDGVLNDDLYDYDTVALPTLADVAEAVARGMAAR